MPSGNNSASRHVGPLACQGLLGLVPKRRSFGRISGQQRIASAHPCVPTVAGPGQLEVVQLCCA